MQQGGIIWFVNFQLSNTVIKILIEFDYLPCIKHWSTMSSLIYSLLNMIKQQQIQHDYNKLDRVD